MCVCESVCLVRCHSVAPPASPTLRWAAVVLCGTWRVSCELKGKESSFHAKCSQKLALISWFIYISVTYLIKIYHGDTWAWRSQVQRWPVTTCRYYLRYTVLEKYFSWWLHVFDLETWRLLFCWNRFKRPKFCLWLLSWWSFFYNAVVSVNIKTIRL